LKINNLNFSDYSEKSEKISEKSEKFSEKNLEIIFREKLTVMLSEKISQH
jgi:hypothetical protein